LVGQTTALGCPWKPNPEPGDWFHCCSTKLATTTGANTGVRQFPYRFEYIAFICSVGFVVSVFCPHSTIPLPCQNLKRPAAFSFFSFLSLEVLMLSQKLDTATYSACFLSENLR